jgi:hypothetical protein
MPQLFTNNARALLTASITDTATSIVVEAAKADLFPVANTGTGSVPAVTNWFKATLQDSTGAVEIVYVRTRTAGSGIFSNVLRAQEGTTALAFSAGTVVGLRVTAADFEAALGLIAGDNTFSGDNTFLEPITGDVVGNVTGVVAAAAGSTAVTASFGDNDTSIATTAFVQAALQALHPVGSIYINAGVTTNPATLLGFGTWVAFGAGRVMVGLDAGNALFDTLEETGGSANAVVVSHTHTTTVTDPGHRHNIGQALIQAGSGAIVGYPIDNTSSPTPVTTAVTGISVAVNSAGVSGTNANLQPYITVAVWKRTA